MAEYTENLNLKMPESTDFVNIEDINNNMRTIDSEVGMVGEKLDNAAENIGGKIDDAVTVVENKIDSAVNSVGEKTDNVNGLVETVNNKTGNTNDTDGSETEGTIFAKLNKIIKDIAEHIGVWTSTRAESIDNIESYTATNNTASKTGVLSQKDSYMISLLENGTYGLNAIKTAASSSGVVKSIQYLQIHQVNVTTTDSATNQNYKDYTITAVDMNKTFINGLGGALGDGGRGASGKFINNTTLRVYGTSGSYIQYVTMQLVEFY